MNSKKILWFLLLGLLACKGKTGSGGGSIIGGGDGDGGDKPGEDDPVNFMQVIHNPPDWKGTDITSSGLEVDGEGNLIIPKNEWKESPFMWLADTSNSMVSKFNVRTGKEVARYRTLFPFSCKEGEVPGNCSLAHAVPANNAPSRTAIDADGNAWVANRGFGGLSSVTKIAADEAGCVRRKGGEKPNTSRDLNGNGAIEPNEVLGVGEDDCVLFSTPVCSNKTAGARALAIDANGDAWVGCYDDKTAYQLDSKNGRIKRGPIALGIAPYGAIVDGRKNVWMTAVNSGQIQGVNIETGEVLNKDAAGKPTAIAPTDVGSCYSYGLAVDAQNRVWLSGGCFYNHYAPEGESKWLRCPTSGRGIVVDADNNVYVSNGSTLTSYRWDDATKTCKPNPIGAAGTNSVNTKVNTLIGVGLDFEGNPWSVGITQAVRVNWKTGEQLTTQPAAGHSPSHYTYSDFTGYQMRNFTAPRGTYRQTIEGCELYSAWKTLSWEAEVPEGTRLSVSVRVAETREGLFTAERHVFEHSPADLSTLGTSTFLQVEFVLESSEDRQTSPTLKKYTIEWACERPLG